MAEFLDMMNFIFVIVPLCLAIIGGFIIAVIIMVLLIHIIFSLIEWGDMKYEEYKDKEKE